MIEMKQSRWLESDLVHDVGPAAEMAIETLWS
jgi:hypothetical protein